MTSLLALPTFGWILLFAAAIAVPLLIHLIHLVRYRKIRWAAMEFLLQSHRKRRKRIWLAQLMLITSRILILMLAMLFLGHVGCQQNREVQLESGTIHLVLVDDSCSMQQIAESQISPDTDTSDPVTCFANAKRTIARLADDLSQLPGQKIQLIRFSDLARANPEGRSFDCNSTGITSLKVTLNQMRCTDLSFSPSQLLDRLFQSSDSHSADASRQVYLLSDFRTKDWPGPKLEEDLQRWNQVAPVQAIQCGEQQESCSNLGIVGLKPVTGIMTAGVPFLVDLQVTNFGDLSVRNVVVDVRVLPFEKGGFDEGTRYLTEPSLLIDQINPGKTKTIRFPILLSSPGWHLIEVSIPDDELRIDNQFQLLVEPLQANRTLIISDERVVEKNYAKWALQPKESQTGAFSGFEVDELTTPQADRLSLEDLSQYQSVLFLSDHFPESNQPGEANSRPELVAKLENYVKQGGLLVVVPGDFADVQQMNAWMFRGGKGLLPCPFDSVVDLSDRRPEVTSDIQIVDPQLAAFLVKEGQLLDLVQFRKKWIPAKGWNADSDSSLQVLAKLRGRNTTPAVVSKQFGKGRAITFLTSFDPEWNNWAKNPTFVVLIHQLINLNSVFDSSQSIPVGGIWKTGFLNESVHTIHAEYQRNLLTPWVEQKITVGTYSKSDNEKSKSRTPASLNPVDSPPLVLRGSDLQLAKKGWYVFHSDGKTFRFTTLLDHSECSLQMASPSTNANTASTTELESGSDPFGRLMHWSRFSVLGRQQTHTPGSLWFVLLIMLLTIEQWMACRLGYHSRRGADG